MQVDMGLLSIYAYGVMQSITGDPDAIQRGMQIENMTQWATGLEISRCEKTLGIAGRLHLLRLIVAWALR